MKISQLEIKTVSSGSLMVRDMLFSQLLVIQRMLFSQLLIHVGKKRIGRQDKVHQVCFLKSGKELSRLLLFSLNLGEGF